MKQAVSGTKEWSTCSVNCLSGCEHDCRYCYARQLALRCGRIKEPGDWAEAKLRPAEVKRPRKLVKGTVMFPTTHDITPQFLEPCLTVLEKLLAAGNRVLIVSKPHYDCIRAICREFVLYRERILFRFTIGAMDDILLAYWEPKAPTFTERLVCLGHATREGFATSVSGEPLLDAQGVIQLFQTLEPCINETFWIGKMNQIRARVVPGTSEQAIRRIEAGQTDQEVRRVYEALKDQPKIRWKESYKAALGLQRPVEAGLDV